MVILPAIDLMDGKVVRLKQGQKDAITVYSDDPVAFAQRWEAEGGDYLHLVDLDAAFMGEPQNLDTIAKITKAVTIPCELGGGMRSEEAVARALDAGISRIVIGTRAAESVTFVEAVAERFGSDKIAVGIDARDGIVSVKGWTESAGMEARELAKRVETAGAGTIIYTDIATDGMMQGPNFLEIEKMLRLLRCKLVASGGVSTIKDIQRLAEMPKLYGAIIGKALYEKTILLEEAKKITANAPSEEPQKLE